MATRCGDIDPAGDCPPLSHSCQLFILVPCTSQAPLGRIPVPTTARPSHSHRLLTCSSEEDVKLVGSNFHQVMRMGVNWLGPSAVVIYMAKHCGMSADDIDKLMNKQSGFLGMCGSSDLRAVLAGIKEGDSSSQLALDVSINLQLPHPMATPNWLTALILESLHF